MKTVFCECDLNVNACNDTVRHGLAQFYVDFFPGNLFSKRIYGFIMALKLSTVK